MFVLVVGCLGYCPHSFLHCFEAPVLPKSAARQIRSEASKTALRSSYAIFLRRGMPTCECQAVLYWTPLTSFRIFVVFPFCLHLLCLFRFPPFALRDNSFRFQAYTRHPSLFDFSNCQTYTVLNAYSSFCALPSGKNYQAASRLRSVSSSLYVDSMMRVRIVDWWISPSNLQLAALTF